MFSEEVDDLAVLLTRYWYIVRYLERTNATKAPLFSKYMEQGKSTKNILSCYLKTIFFCLDQAIDKY